MPALLALSSGPVRTCSRLTHVWNATLFSRDRLRLSVHVDFVVAIDRRTRRRIRLLSVRLSSVFRLVSLSSVRLLYSPVGGDRSVLHAIILPHAQKLGDTQPTSGEPTASFAPARTAFHYL